MIVRAKKTQVVPRYRIYIVYLRCSAGIGLIVPET